MKKFLFVLTVYVVLTLLSIKLFATAQFGDIFWIHNKKQIIFTNPLESYFQFKGSRIIDDTLIVKGNSACDRGYIATWEIINDSLFLTNLVSCDMSRSKYNLKKEFGLDTVFASWFTGTIRSPRGERIQYYHGGYESIYEYDYFYDIKNGVMIGKSEVANFEYDSTRLNPAEKFLEDTIRKIVISKYDSVKIEEMGPFNDILIYFNEDGAIDTIDTQFCRNKNIIVIALNELQNFPKIMRVRKNNQYIKHFINVTFYRDFIRPIINEKKRKMD